MPADKDFTMLLGGQGLNLRDNIGQLNAAELADSMNFRIVERGGLEKRRGTIDVGGDVPAGVLNIATYAPSSGTKVIAAAAADGHVYTTPENGTWTSIASGLSTTATPTFVQYLDKLYWSNGTNFPQEWDGTTLTALSNAATTKGDAPKGKYVAVWRNRLWISGVATNPHRVYWSKAGDPRDWTVTANYVDFPDSGVVTGITPAPNPGATTDGSDGLLVFTDRKMHRIYDDSDNAGGVVTGGANVVADPAQGTVGHRTVAQIAGRVWCLGRDGIYSTDGHSPLRLESGQLGRFIIDSVEQSRLAASACAAVWQGNYLASVTTRSKTSNNLILEAYPHLPTRGDGFHPIMAMDWTASAMTVFPNTNGDRLYFADASSGDTSRVRRYASGGTDVTGTSTVGPITAYARTGALTFDITGQKRFRRLHVDGRGKLLVGVAGDYEGGTGDSDVLQLTTTSDTWSVLDAWNVGVWGPLAQALDGSLWFQKSGRRFTLFFLEDGSTTSTSRTRLSVNGSESGGSAIYSLNARITPLNAD